MFIVAQGATVCQLAASAMKLCRPFSLRLSPELLQWLDKWRGDAMSRGTAIRVLLEKAMANTK